jgi:histone acetyltransferase (RNA polymerase elongator complex component)
MVVTKKLLKNMVIPSFIPHKGCPFDCIYCNQKTISGQTQEIKISEIHDIITSYVKSAPKGAHIEVGFYGGSFTGIEKEQQITYLKAANAFIATGDIAGIRLSTRPDYINIQILEYLKEYGVKTIELGVQSLDDEVLKLSNRGHNREIVFKSSKLIKDAGFELGIQTMIGLPGDTKEKDLSTLEGVIQLSPQIVRIYPTLVIKNTYLENLFYKGDYTPLTLKNAVDICSDLLDMYESNGINVIRIGLQPTESINEGMDIVAGPFHPAFRQLVESKSLLKKIENLILQKNIKQDDKFEIQTREKYLSSIVGQKKENINYLKKKYGFKDINIVINENLINKFNLIKSRK